MWYHDCCDILTCKKVLPNSGSEVLIVEIAMLGLPGSGKTTLFNALTGSKREVSATTSVSAAPNVGVSKLIDPRLHVLEEMLKPKRVVPAEVKYIDTNAFAQGPGTGGGLSTQSLNSLSQAHALMHVVRRFPDETVPHPMGNVNPQRDVSHVDGELVLSDLLRIERRQKRLEDSLKGAKPEERPILLREQALLGRVKSSLETNVPVRELRLSGDEGKILEGLDFLTAKPVLIALNIGEQQLAQIDAEEEGMRKGYRHPHSTVVAICGKLEMELAQLSHEEAKEFQAALGMKESRTNPLVEACFQLLGLISFFTIASGEIRSWTIPSGTAASRAAGKIHSDMERGFIRAEVISYIDLSRCSSLSEAKKKGLLRQEGRSYAVQDGDIITFLFNV